MKRPEYLQSGDLARLIPVASKPEMRNTSITCAMLMAVEEYADVLLSPLGAPIGKRTKIQIWTEPVFKGQKKDTKGRPDALVIADNGRRQWRALIEAKAKGSNLESGQIECYLDLAKANGIDALITLSNQFVATPTQSPCEVNRVKTKKVSLFHWSWSYLKTEAKIQLSKSAVSDPDQAYILDEFVRYLEHDSAGVTEFDQMGKEWVEAGRLLFANTLLPKGSPLGTAVVRDWDELMRCTALRLSRRLGTNVTTILSAKERKDPGAHLKRLLNRFSEKGSLKSRLDIPGAASPISIEADLTRRSVTVSMEVGAPKDKKRAPATVNWLLRQLAKTKNDRVLIIAKWPGRTGDTIAELGKARENMEALVESRPGQLPHTFEIKSVSDLRGKFTQRRNFVPELIARVNYFYDEVGLFVVPWQAPPPKPKYPSQGEELASPSSPAPASRLPQEGSLEIGAEPTPS